VENKIINSESKLNGGGEAVENRVTAVKHGRIM
jgi:hypothetical protein